MNYLHKYRIILFFITGIVAAVLVGHLHQTSSTPPFDVTAELLSCEQYEREPQKLDCWYEVMRVVHNREGTAAAFDVFNTLYENEPLFARTGCHLHSHRIGDFTYYDNYVVYKDLDKIEFPDGSQVCGYGFYHGFFEHLVQDNPNPGYVTELCEYFDKRLGARMPSMRITCYHGSGHGFTLAQVDEGDMSHWGNYESIIAKPLDLCGQLPNATDNEREECRQGVFNVLVLWMESKEHGLEYDWENPFWLCESQEEVNKNSCYYEVGQKLDRVSDYNIEKTIEILDTIPDQQFVGSLLSTAIAGFLQRTITTDQQFEYIETCTELRESLQKDCISGVVGGLMEHGDPGDEHVKAIEICSVPNLNDDQRAHCFNDIESKLKRFHSDAVIDSLCRDYDSALFREACGSFQK